MNEKLTNKDIDNIFRNSVENLETEPSESFWIKASEDTLFKSTQAHSREVTRWKMVAFALAAMLLASSAYVVYTQKQVSIIKHEVSRLEKKTEQTPALGNAIVAQNAGHNQIPLAATEKKNYAAVTSVPASSSVISSVNHKAVQHGTGYALASSQKAIVNSNTTFNKALPVAAYPANEAASATNTIVAAKGNPAPLVAASENNVSVTTNPPDEMPVQKTTAAEPAKGNVSSASGILVDNNTADVTTASAGNAMPSQQEPATAPNDKKPAAQTQVTAKTVTGNAAAPQAGTPTPAATGNKIVSHLAASLFYEPYLSDELFEKDMADNTIINNVVSSEEEVNPYKLGVRIGYDISPRLSVISGCYYYSFRVSVKPTVIYAQKQQNGDVGYYFQTSLGIVTCPYEYTPKAGDGIVINGMATATYLSIPLLLKYTFINTGNLKLYVTAGVAANMVTYSKMSMHWQNFSWEEGDAVEGISGSQMTHYTYYFSPGISYKLVKGFSVYAEPSIQGSPVLWGKSTSSANSAPFIGAGGGITYHF